MHNSNLLSILHPTKTAQVRHYISHAT